MPHFERGPYEPSDDVRVFDGSEDDEDPEGSRLPLLIVLALLVLAMFGAVVWMAYSYGVVHGRTEPQLLAAAPGPARVAPANPGGAETPYKGFKIYEQPAPPDDEADATPAATPAATTKAPAPAPVEAAKPAEPAMKETAPPPVAMVKQAAPPPAVKPQPAKVAMAAPVKAAPPPPEAQATAPPKSLLAPAPKPAAAPKPVAEKPVAAAPAASGSYVLQIGAYKSQADADTAWRSYKAKHAALLAGYGPDVAQADLGDKGIWYRLRIAGFASKDVASAMCDRLKADGGSCFLGK